MKLNARFLSVALVASIVQENTGKADGSDWFNRISQSLSGLKEYASSSQWDPSCTISHYRSVAEELWENVNRILSFGGSCLEGEYNISKELYSPMNFLNRSHFRFLEKEITENPKCLPKEFVKSYIELFNTLQKEGWDPDRKDVLSLLYQIEIHKNDWFNEANGKGKSADGKERVPKEGEEGKSVFKRVFVKDGLASLVFMPNGRIILFYKNKFLGKGGEKVAYSQIELGVEEEKNYATNYIGNKVIARLHTNDAVKGSWRLRKLNEEEFNLAMRILDEDPGRSKEEQVESLVKRLKNVSDFPTLEGKSEEVIRDYAEKMANGHISAQKINLLEKEIAVFKKILELRKKDKKYGNNLAVGEVVEFSREKPVVPTQTQPDFIVQTKYEADLFEWGYHRKPAELATLYERVAKGLVNFHRTGLVHCDLKPENIFMEAGSPYIADFGGAYNPLTKEDPCATYTPGYMPLERFTKAGPPEELTPEEKVQWHQKKDVYSLGVMIMESLKLETRSMRHDIDRVFNEANAEFNFKIANEKATELCQKVNLQNLTSFDPGIQCKLASIAADCLNPKVDERPNSLQVLGRLSNNYSEEVLRRLNKKTGAEDNSAVRD